MKVFRSVATIFTVAVMTLLPVATSSAADVCNGCRGSEVYVNSLSNGKVVIDDDGRRADVWAYQSSWNFQPDVDYFWVPGGCDAWNYTTGYKYVGNKWYGPLNDVVRISLTVKC